MRSTLIAVAALVAASTSAAPAAAATQTFTPVADAYVSSASPATNFGAAHTLSVDASPTVRSYVRFDVALPAGATVSAATLRLYTTTASTGTGYQVFPVSSVTWGETTVTSSTAPALGARLATSGTWSTTGYKAVTLPAGSVHAGLNSFAAATTSTTSKSFHSREGVNKPQLAVTYTVPSSDTTPPNTTITAQPADGPSTSASFSFASTETGSSFACMLDTGSFTACTSPSGYSALAVGTHSFSVVATDAAGNKDPTPATATWTVTAAPPTPAGACGGMAGPPHITKVVWIWFENKGYGNITPAAAPYFNQIKGECGYASNYTSTTACVSLPEYISSTSGSPQGVCDDAAPSAHPLDVANVFRQIEAAGKTWTSYQEAMPSNCLRTTSGTYAVKHNPAAYYVGATGANACATNDVPLPASPGFGSDFTIVEPDLCNSMHDCAVSTGDSWLSRMLPKVISSSDYQAGNTAVFVTFDEGGGAGGEVLFTLALSKYTVPGTVSGAGFNHFALLRTLQTTLGLPCLVSSCTAGDMAPAFAMR